MYCPDKTNIVVS